MTKFNPSIVIQRLLIIKDAKPVYDQVFHLGINIIRGDNGTGKSTIMDLIFFALGGDVKGWTAEAASCDAVFCELLLNEKVFTFIREIEQKEKSKMCIYEGALEDSKSNVTNWQVFPYASSAFKKSFTQIVMNILGMPYHKTDDNANLTLHQLLRFIYVDQITPPTMIFRQEEQFDSENTRTAIGEYLLGLDDLEVHKLRQELLKFNKEFDEIHGELKAIYSFLGAQNTLLNVSSVQNEIESVTKQIALKRNDLEQIRTKKVDELELEAASKTKVLHAEVSELSEQFSGLLKEKEELVSEIMDITLFLNAIRDRIKCLEESETTQLELGSLSFRYCPVCLSVISENESADHCYLCKTSSVREGDKSPYLRMRRDLDFQLVESQKVLEINKARLDEANTKIPAVINTLNKKKYELNLLQKSDTYSDALASNFLVDIGYMNKSIDTLKEKMLVAQNLDILSDKKEHVQGMINKTRTRLEQLQASNIRRKELVYSLLKKQVLEIIRLDDFEPEFKNAEDFDYNFGKNKTEINGRSRFSASSMVYLKNAFRLTVLLASLADPKIRFPRFMLMDNIEDKGMQPVRSHSFQYHLVDFCKGQEVAFQVIFTTSMIAPDLEDSDLCVGPYYKKGMHTLQF
ncbi:MAG: hypothetical protein A2X82_00650 [Geobacteraceae bacterium GWC2_55_20]|nr:MAG: hypothetical protein A2X82_00650 [Geobacteraceae bacterium GWC2_55_20]OGU18778.1 MAG: hypothetical protein A2X85_08910 [Geobacteraceae bacterium GWF2_54_21]HBA71208.1 hypothetical protein [Geobacter sp.]